jgi:hypothetical protein
MINREKIDGIFYRRIKLAQEQPDLLKAPDEWLIELKYAIDCYLQANGLPDTESKCNKHVVIKPVCDICGNPIKDYSKDNNCCDECWLKTS